MKQPKPKLCEKCKESIMNAPANQGACICLCPDCDIREASNFIERNQKKMLNDLFLDFFRDSTLFFKGRVDEGDISLKEINDYIHNWIEVNFNDLG